MYRVTCVDAFSAHHGPVRLPTLACVIYVETLDLPSIIRMLARVLASLSGVPDRNSGSLSHSPGCGMHDRLTDVALKNKGFHNPSQARYIISAFRYFLYSEHSWDTSETRSSQFVLYHFSRVRCFVQICGTASTHNLTICPLQHPLQCLGIHQWTGLPTHPRECPLTHSRLHPLPCPPPAALLSRGPPAARRVLGLVAVVSAVCAISFGPFIAMGQLGMVRSQHIIGSRPVLAGIASFVIGNHSDGNSLDGHNMHTTKDITGLSWGTYGSLISQQQCWLAELHVSDCLLLRGVHAGCPVIVV